MITDYRVAKALQWKAAIDFKWIRENNEAVAANVKNRNSNANIDLVVELYDKLMNVQKEVEGLRAERNVVANRMKGKLEPSERQKLVEEALVCKGWAVGGSNGSDDEDGEEEENLTGMNMAVNFANPVQRKEKKSLNFSWLRETMNNNGGSVPVRRKARAFNWIDGSGRRILTHDDALLNRADFDAKEKDVTMEDEASTISEEVKEKRQDTLALVFKLFHLCR